MPADATPGEALAHAKSGNRVADEVMRTPYLEQSGTPRPPAQTPPPTAPDDALIRLMVPRVAAAVPPPLDEAALRNPPPAASTRDDKRRPDVAAVRPTPLSNPPARAAPCVVGPNRRPDSAALVAPTTPAPDWERAGGGEHRGGAAPKDESQLIQSLRGDSEWLFAPEEQLADATHTFHLCAVPCGVAGLLQSPRCPQLSIRHARNHGSSHLQPCWPYRSSSPPRCLSAMRAEEPGEGERRRMRGGARARRKRRCTRCERRGRVAQRTPLTGPRQARP